MEEAKVINQDENVDNVLNSVSDQYLAKRKRNRKITFSIISFIVLALATIIIVMSCVKVNIKPQFIDDATSYRVTINGSDKLLLEEGNEEFAEFDELFDETFSLNYLTALFSGKLGGYKINASDETKDYFYSDTKNNKGMSTSLKNALGDSYVRVKFGEEKEVTYSNGKTYMSKYNTNSKLVFDELYFNLSETNEEGSLTFYLGTRGYLSGTRITKITIEANTYALYEFANN